MKMKKTLAAILAASIVLGISACGSSDSGRGGETTTTPANADADVTTTTSGPSAGDQEFTEAEVVEIDENQETGTIKVLIYYDLVTQDADLVDLFETRYGGSIEQEICSNGGAYFDKLGTLVASDLSPDITRYEWRSFPHGMSRNMYTPIDSYIDLESDLWSDMKEIADQFVYNGKHYYVPYKITSNFALNYNRLLLQEYGLADPIDLYQSGEWNWTAFRDLITQWCNADENHIGYTGVSAMSFVSTTGTKLIDVTDNQIINNLKNENVQRAMEFVEDLCRQGLTGDGYVDPGEAFLDGNLLFLGMEPTWAYSAACESLFKKSVDYDMAFVPFPRDDLADQYYLAYDSFGYMIPSGAKNVKGAVDWITLNRTEETDPENVAEAKATATDSSPKYYPKCPECKYSYVENETEDLTVCPECNTPRREKFNAWYTEEQYEVLQDLITPERGKFSFLFDNCKGFNEDLSNIFEGMGDQSLMDGPIWDNVSYTQLRDENYNMIESILDEYREKMAQG
ncbi:MAG: ABC transporter substrate-binding protein [Bacteroides sp.]|nr:ABC transporter substrate-binding protein [Eubacterium sp.]MCM1418229.1 ABC transporter substrate-binding protein [Roseburia sp.]MCM1463534.1 ABC transporter substrate-binding protein [Bacteroides sp.]